MMNKELRETLQCRLQILQDELAALPESMQVEPKQLLREMMEENLAIAKVDGNQEEMDRFKAALTLIDELES